MDDYKTFTFSYPFQGERWCFDLQARDADEAEARFRALAWGRLDGELVARIPVPDPVGPLRRLWQWAVR